VSKAIDIRYSVFDILWFLKKLGLPYARPQGSSSAEEADAAGSAEEADASSR
jgi:hypothetical protein